MKKFITRILLFAIILLALAILADIFLSKQFYETTDYRYAVWNDILKGNMDNDIIIMGSSRSWVQISPQILDSVLRTNTYNIGMDGSCIDRQIAMYKIYRKYNKKPKLIIQNVDWLATLQNGTHTDYLLEQYYPYFYNADMREFVIPVERFDFFDLYIPLLRYYRYTNMKETIEMIRGLSNPEWGVEKGYKGMERKWNGSKLENVDSLYFEYDQSSLEEFCDYLSECKKDSIQVIFVYTPAYVEGVQKVVNMSDFYNLFDSVANEYNVVVLDYLNNEICSDKAYFYNAMHLNKHGAEKFSQILAHDIDSLGLLGI